MVYLILRYESAMRKVDRIVKGAACSAILVACIKMTDGSGGSINPALGFAHSIYMIGYENTKLWGLGNTDAKFIWVYMVFPYVGASIAAAFFRLHIYIDKNEYN